MPDRPRFELTFNLGHAIIIATALAGFVGSHYLTDYRLTAVERKLDSLSGLLIEAAVTAERVKGLERRIEFVERR
jgi:hypothetical protein